MIDNLHLTCTEAASQEDHRTLAHKKIPRIMMVQERYCNQLGDFLCKAFTNGSQLHAPHRGSLLCYGTYVDMTNLACLLHSCWSKQLTSLATNIQAWSLTSGSSREMVGNWNDQQEQGITWICFVV